MSGEDERLPEQEFSEEDWWSNYDGSREAIEQTIRPLVREVIKHIKQLYFIDQERTAEYIIDYVRNELACLVSTEVTRKIIASEFGLDPDHPLWEPPPRQTSSTES
jgi:hypothetical protein